MYNHKQLKAITCNDRFIFVNAGAGSGKTTVMIERMKRLIHEGVSEEDILGLTFSKEAAMQMKERLNIENVFISTFHSFCYQHLEGFDVIPKSVPFSKEFLLKVSLYKNKMGQKPFFYQRYISYLKKHKFIDYDDMLIRFISIKDVYAYKHILIDEFQDTNFLQISVLLKLIHYDTFVFVVDNHHIPYRFSRSMFSIEEERRLFYVGITRARHALYFIHYKYDKNVKLSKFIDEISDNQVFKAIK